LGDSYPPIAEMTNEKLTTLLTGALIASALWFRVLADDAIPTRQVIDTADNTEVISAEMKSPEEIQVALNETDEFGKICTNAEGSLVECLETSEDTICIRTRVGAHSGIRIDCKTDQPVLTDQDGMLRAYGAKYRSPY